MKWDRLKCRALDAFELKLLKTCCAVLSRSVMSDYLQPARLLCSLKFSRQEYWNRLPCPAPGDLPNPRIEPVSLRSQALAGSLPLAPPGKPQNESCSVMSNSLRPHGLYIHGILWARILEWVAIPFSRGSSRPRNQARVSYIAGRFFTN